MSENTAITEFLKLYSPDRVKGYQIPPRSLDDIPVIDEKQPQLRNIALTVDKQRAENPTIGMQLAAKEIMNNLLQWLKNDRGVQAESLIAVLGAMAGHELKRAIMDTIQKTDDEKVLGALNMVIAGTKDGEKYLFGDFVGNEFCSIYMTAAQSRENPSEKLMPISHTCASAGGSEKYWETPYNDEIGITPKGITELFEHKFDAMFQTFTRFPNERPMAYAVAAQEAIKQTEQVLPKEKALSILAEFGWRTSHYIGI